jgi:Holliday junction DNA helicase RuvA
MFYYLKGTVALMDANLAVIDCNGVGYACHCTTFTQSQLRVGKPAQLFTYCNIREDAFDIYGFATREELRSFEMLLGVSGVGTKAALAILSSTTPDQFSLAILSGDEKTLTAAPGVGKKLAQRILLELKDKLAAQQTEFDFSGGGTPAVAAVRGTKAQEASAALAALGYSSSDIAVALKGVDAEALSGEDIIKQGLRTMVRKF